MLGPLRTTCRAGDPSIKWPPEGPQPLPLEALLPPLPADVEEEEAPGKEAAASEAASGRRGASGTDLTSSHHLVPTR